MISEQMSPFTQFTLGKQYPVWIIVAASVVFIAAFFYGKALNPKDRMLFALLFLFLLALSLSAHRYVPFLALLSAPLAAGLFRDRLERLNRFLKQGLVSISLALFMLYAVLFGRSFGSTDSLLISHYPQDLVGYAKANNLSGNIFNSYDIGGYLLWSLYPEVSVFIDNRGLVPEVFREYLVINSGSDADLFGLPEWKALLRGHGIQHIILTTLNRYGNMPALIIVLNEDPEWKLLYFDKASGALLISREDLLPEYPKIFAYTSMLENANALRAANPGNPNIYVTLAQIHILLNRKPEAIGLLEEAVRQYPSFADNGPGRYPDYLRNK